MNPDPSRSTTLSRRAVLTGLASIAAVPTATGAANSTATSSFGQPSIPQAFHGEPWEQNNLGESDNNDVAWIGQSLQNTAMQSRVQDDLGINPPLWNLYTWNLQTIRSEKYIDYNGGDDGGGIPFVSQVSLPIGPGSVFIDLDEIDQFLEDITESVVSATAVELFTDQVESDYPFSQIDICSGLYDEELFSCRFNDVSYSNAEAILEDSFTITATHTATNGDDEFEIEYRGFLVVQTYNRGESYTAAGVVYPERMDDEWWGDYEFGASFIDDSRDFMKNTK
ncbi:hypothetical protein [Halomontanus rarus]|uniref:hypothetical protein n=1 Tax=Halomontanus rarus TaxID=3034020 RepID=UPI001A9889BB